MRQRQIAKLQLLLSAFATLMSSSQANDYFCFDDMDPGSFFESHDNTISSVEMLDNGYYSSKWPFGGKQVSVDLDDVKAHLISQCGNQITWPTPDYDDCPNFFVNEASYCSVPGLIKGGAVSRTFRVVDETSCVPNALASYDCAGVKVEEASKDWPLLIGVGAAATCVLLMICSCLLNLKASEENDRTRVLLDGDSVQQNDNSPDSDRHSSQNDQRRVSSSASSLLMKGVSQRGYNALDDGIEQGHAEQDLENMEQGNSPAQA